MNTNDEKFRLREILKGRKLNSIDFNTLFATLSNEIIRSVVKEVNNELSIETREQLVISFSDPYQQYSSNHVVKLELKPNAITNVFMTLANKNRNSSYPELTFQGSSFSGTVNIIYNIPSEKEEHLASEHDIRELTFDKVFSVIVDFLQEVYN